MRLLYTVKKGYKVFDLYKIPRRTVAFDEDEDGTRPKLPRTAPMRERAGAYIACNIALQRTFVYTSPCRN